MTYQYYCVVDPPGNYKTLVVAHVTPGEPDGENIEVISYRLAEGEELIRTAAPVMRQHVGMEGFLKPRWEGERGTTAAITGHWVEGATPEEIAAWEAEHPAPPTPLPSRVEVLEAEVTRLRAQNELQAQHQTFLEDCLLEMGNVVYA